MDVGNVSDEAVPEALRAGHQRLLALDGEVAALIAECVRKDLRRRPTSTQLVTRLMLVRRVVASCTRIFPVCVHFFSHKPCVCFTRRACGTCGRAASVCRLGAQRGLAFSWLSYVLCQLDVVYDWVPIHS